jgi:hypothetical protein
MPIDMKISSAVGNEVQVVFNDKRAQNFVLHTDEEPLSITLDVERWISREVLWESYDFHIINDNLSDGIQLDPYEDSVVVKSSNDNYYCEVISGSMPSGWNLDPTSGVITGTSYSSGTHIFVIRAVDQDYPSSRDSVEYTVEISGGAPLPGDANVDGVVDVGDAVHIINYVFKGGPAPPVPNLADVNVDCEINIGDAVSLINFVFRDGSAPQMGCVE